MPVRLLTTGKAAELCSVKPDTVLKWIKKGRLSATRTAGGHYRVDEHQLLPFLPKTNEKDVGEGRAEAAAGPCAVHSFRCWEYMSDTLRDECRDCVAYQTHAAWCFELMKVVHGAGHTKRFCSGACQECPYYRRVHGEPTNVLIVTRDEALIQSIAWHPDGCLACRFARNGYDASAIISVFRPAVVIVGERVAAEETGLVKALANDPRTPGVRVLLGVRENRTEPTAAGSGIAGTIRAPFSCDELAAWAGRLPVEVVPVPGLASHATPPSARNGGRRPGKSEPIPA